MWSPIRGVVDVRSSVWIVRVLGRGFKGVSVFFCDEKGVFFSEGFQIRYECLGFFWRGGVGGLNLWLEFGWGFYRRPRLSVGVGFSFNCEVIWVIEGFSRAMAV